MQTSNSFAPLSQMQQIINSFKKLWLVALLLMTLPVYSQDPDIEWIDSLLNVADDNNKRGDFKKSIAMYNDALNSDTITAYHRYYLYIYKSYTYKWLGDYNSVERNLTLALQAAAKTMYYKELRAYAQIDLATMYFDTQNYEKADSVMRIIRSTNFDKVDPYEKALILMQEGYLLFLKKDYTKVEVLYKESISIMENSNSHCSTPIVYWKLQALYLAQRRLAEAEAAINTGLEISKTCKVDKYVQFMYGEAAIHYAKIGLFEKAFSYGLKNDSVKEAINQKEHLSQIAGLEKEFQQEREIETQQLAKKSLEARTNLNYLITALVLVLVLISILIYSWLRYRKTKRYRRLKDRFTAELLNNIEQERKRIATDLHDGVSHELLAVKMKIDDSGAQQSISDIIQEIRRISRNLHPVMFEKLGLKSSLEQMVDRLQESTSIIIITEISYSSSGDALRELQLFRIAQEAVGNAVKYSNAIAIRVGLYQDKQNTILEIKDNGKGFDVQSKIEEGMAFGLQSIYQRAESLGGNVQLRSSATGTQVIINIPTNDPIKR